jgi:hypothetical protein
VSASEARGRGAPREAHSGIEGRAGGTGIALTREREREAVNKSHIVFGLYLLSNLLFIAGSLVGMFMKDK